MEVGDEITDVSVAYAGSDGYDEESATGSDPLKGGGDDKGTGVRERKVGRDFE